jgi:serine/threonine protein kinase
MVLKYCTGGNLRNYLNNSNIKYKSKEMFLLQIIRGLLNIHDAGKVHKDFHSGNILFNYTAAYIGDLGMCQPVNNEKKLVKKGIYGVLPYMAPEVLCGYQYTKASDIYSFGIIMNEFISEKIPFNNIPHDHVLAVKICKGLRPKISEDTPKLFADLIVKCWDSKAENRPTAKELFHILSKWSDEIQNKTGEIYSQIEECEKIRKIKLKKLKKNNLNENKFENVKVHPQAIYTSRLFNFKNLPEPINSSNLSSPFQLNSGMI